MTTLKLIFGALFLTVLFNYCSSKTDKSNSIDASKADAIVQKIDTSLNGLYSGLEYMDTVTDPVYPGKLFKEYHLGYLKIKGDSTFLDQNPIFVYKHDTTYSASDGGFYYYSGTWQKNDTVILFNLKELFCDYCAILVKTKTDGTQEAVKRTKQLKGRLTNKGFIIDGYLYAQTTKKEDLISEHPQQYLKSQ